MFARKHKVQPFTTVIRTGGAGAADEGRALLMPRGPLVRAALPCRRQGARPGSCCPEPTP